MIDFLRVYLPLLRHRKFRRLRRSVGDRALEHLILLWFVVAEQAPSGTLAGWTEQDIADAAEWDEDAASFAASLHDAGFLDRDGDTWVVHDWADHQPFVVGESARIERCRQAGLKSAEKRRRVNGTAQPKTRRPRAAKTAAVLLPEIPADHPAIQALREVAGRYPRKELWPSLVDLIGATPNVALLKKCRLEWIERGFNPESAKWATEWYRDGIPEGRGNHAGSGTRKHHGRSTPTEPNPYDQAAGFC